MAEIHPHQQPPAPTNIPVDYLPEKGPSTSQVLAVVTLVPFAGVLITFAGIILAGTLMGLAVVAPLFVIFSPILVPAVLTLALAVAGFITSGAFGLTALSSVLCLLSYVRRMSGNLPGQLEHAAEYLGMKTREAGQKNQESKM